MAHSTSDANAAVASAADHYHGESVLLQTTKSDAKKVSKKMIKDMAKENRHQATRVVKVRERPFYPEPSPDPNKLAARPPSRSWSPRLT